MPMGEDQARDALTALSQLNPRRFDLLLACIRLGGAFTTTELRGAQPELAPSLSRDLGALEVAGLVLADPPRAIARQGRPVTYTVAPLARTVFSELAGLVDEAYASRPSGSPAR